MILILNCGSQSIKWKLFDKNLRLKKKGSKEVFSTFGGPAEGWNSKNYQKILTEELNKLKKENIKVIGHRVVHGGGKFTKPTLLTAGSLKTLEQFNKLAPLHNPFNVLGVKVSQKIFPQAKQVAVFDTEFFADLPLQSAIYPLPEKIREKYGFKRFGFHGISHEYVAKEGARIIRKSFNKLKIITCHLGGGASIAAIRNGRAIDTSMGFTPMEGVVMLTRSGNVDPGIILRLAEDMDVQKLDFILNQESGIKGICGLSDMRDVLKAVKRGNRKAKFALEIFVYSIQKYIGAYFAILAGCDLLIFTGAIGSGSAKIVNMICKDLLILKNTKVLSIKTDEELAIAQKIKKF